jgi:hypothetical protein
MNQEPIGIMPPANSDAEWRRAEEQFWRGSAAGRSEQRRGLLWIALALVFVLFRVFFGGLTFQ